VLVGSLPTAALYALIGFGFVLIYRSSLVLNFTQGQLALIGAYLMFAFAQVAHNFYAALVVALIAAFLLGLCLFGVALLPLRGRGPIVAVMATIALNSVLESVTLLIWGPSVRAINSPLSSAPIHLPGGVVTSSLGIAIIAACIVMIVGTLVVLRTTDLGIMMRATSENHQLATHRGIRVDVVVALTWGVAVVGAALAGIGYGVQTGVQPTITTLGFAVFPAVLLGGIDSILGALVGAVIIAFLQGLVSFYFSNIDSSVVGYVVVLAVLVVRPQGLFGSREVVRL
jgi:branched-chain amino acid transport system permease protein